MQKKMMAVCLAALICLALSCAVVAADDAKEFDQEAVLMEYWKADDDTVVGSVNGVTVTKGELVKTMWLWNAPSTLQDILNQKMIQKAAQDSSVELEWADVQKKVDESLQRMGMTNVDQLLNQFRITWWRFMSGTKISALAEKVVQADMEISDAEYAQWIKARHILIKFPQDEEDKEKKEQAAKDQIDKVAQELKDGADFAVLADKYSEDPGNISEDGTKKGGDLGWFTRGRMVQEFENAAFEMQTGEVSEPVKTFYGYHLIKVEKLGKDASPAEKLALNKMIIEKKVPMEMGKWFSDLQARSKIDNKLSPPALAEPAPVVRPRPTVQPKTEPAKPQPNKVKKIEVKPAPKPAEPPAGDKPETPPTPPPPPGDSQ